MKGGLFPLFTLHVFKFIEYLEIIEVPPAHIF